MGWNELAEWIRGNGYLSIELGLIFASAHGR
jgi:hypothetical protein